MQQRCDELEQPGPIQTIYVNPLDYGTSWNAIELPDHQLPNPHISATTFGPTSSVVFPNGYDARPDSQPGDIYIHAVHSSSDMAGTPDTHSHRMVKMSRIEPAL